MQEGNGSNVIVEGRLVWLSGRTPFEGKQKVDLTTKQPRIGKDGQPMMENGFGLAVSKSELAKPGSIWEAMVKEAATLYPSGQYPPSFAWKYKDGDGIDHNGQPFNKREGYGGHIVLTCTTTLDIKWFRWENGGNVMINDGVKCGDYVRVLLQIKAHPAVGQAKPGLYLNPNAVQFLGYGKEIINTPSGDTLFGAAAPAMPAGASAIPIASGPMPMPPAAPQMGAPMMPPTAPAAPQPHYGVIPPNHQPPAGGAPMMGPAPMTGMPMAPAAPQQPAGWPQPPVWPQQ